MSKLFDNHLDLYHRLLMAFPGKYKGADYKIEDIINDMDKKSETSVINVTKTIMHADDFPLYHVSEPSRLMKKMRDYILTSLCHLKIQDICDQYNNSSDINLRLNTYFKKELDNEKLTYYVTLSKQLSEMNNEEFLYFLITKGMAAHLLKYNKEKNMYFIDLIHMYNYTVRKGLLPYGAYVEFDENLKVKFIKLPFSVHILNHSVVDITHNHESYYAHAENNNRWIMAYNVLISTLASYVTVVEHATRCHFIMAGTINYWNHQNKDMNINILNLLKPFLYRTSDINTMAVEVLINEGGLASRLFSFTTKSFNNLMIDTLKNFTYSDIYKIKKDNNVEIDTPFYADAINIWNIIHNFVCEFLKISKIENVPMDSFNEIISVIPTIFDKNKTTYENLIIILTVHIFNVSFWHEHIGNMSMYVLHPKIVKTKIFLNNPFALVDTKQDTVQNINLALLTSSTSMPKIIDDLWKTQTYNKHEYRTVFDNFQKQLLEAKISCSHLDPKLLECSVSL